MPRDLVIDGYNLLHAAGLARRRYGPGDLERARENLLRLIASQVSLEQRRRTTFVFDAKDPHPAASGHGAHADMLVLYAQEDEEADDLIERLIAVHSAPRQLMVVSSDHRLHKAARRRKAVPIDSDEFLDECARRAYARRSERAEPEVKPEGHASPAELAEWLAVFDIDPADLGNGSPPTSPEPRAQPGSTPAAKQPVSQKKERSGQRRGRSKKRTAAPRVIEDVAFWEARIADLFRRNPPEFGDEG